jgi:N utilization substance protein A
MEVIVDDDQLSLAIGRRGQNVRLASQISEWKIDIKTESQVKREQQEVVSLLMTLPNVGEVTANLLYNEGFNSLEDIAFSDPEALVKAAGFKSAEDVEKIQVAARIALKYKLEKMSASEQSPAQIDITKPEESKER